MDTATGTLKFQGEYCREDNMVIKINSRYSEYIKTAEFDVELKANCTPHIHLLGEMPRVFSRTVPNTRTLVGKMMFSRYFESTLPVQCQINYWELRQYNKSYADKNTTCVRVDD